MASVALPLSVFALVELGQPCARRVGQTLLARSRADISAAVRDGGSVGIIGGGIAGITAARSLAKAGVPVVIHERERSLGGRLAATACSYIKGKDPNFVEQLKQWQRDGIVAEWRGAKPHLISAPGVWAPLVDSSEERWYVGVPEMGSPAALSERERDGLIRVHKAEVFDVNFQDDVWVVASTSDDGSQPAPSGAPPAGASLASHLHTELIVATPVHDASSFVDRKLLDRALGRGRYKDFVKERVSASFTFERSLALPFNFCAMTYAGAPATVAICETSRRAAGESAAGGDPAKAGCETWVVQSDTAWASTALDEEWSASAMEEALLDAFATSLGGIQLPGVRESESVVWPYGDMDYALDGGCVWVEDVRLAMAGDWAYNGRVEGAWLSGQAAAARVLDLRTRE